MLSGVLIFSIGCNNNNQPDVSPVNSVAQTQTEFTSEIDLMEKQEGVTFFKKDVWIKDETGKDQVLMRFASVNKDLLDTYLEENHYTLLPISGTISNQHSIDVKPTNNSTNLSTIKQMVITEVVGIKSPSAIKEYVIHVERKSDNTKNKKNGRVSITYSSFTIHVSMNWPTYCRVYATQPIRHSMRVKDRWMNSWSAPSALLEHSSTNTYYEYKYKIDEWWDGPWRARLEVDYNNSSNYDVYFDRY